MFRVALRERNTLAMVLKCVSGPSLALLVPLYVMQSLATAGFSERVATPPQRARSSEAYLEREPGAYDVGGPQGGSTGAARLRPSSPRAHASRSTEA